MAKCFKRICLKILEKKYKALKALWKAEEYFLTVANQENPYGYAYNGPIKYQYFDNTNRELFYVFVKDYIKDHIKVLDYIKNLKFKE